MHDSFLYCWTDHKTQKLYLGVHKGTEDDGYVSSSKYFNEEYDLRAEDFTRKIIAHGMFKDIIALESKILQSLNAAKDDTFYNKTNNDKKFYCSGHTLETRKRMSETWKAKGSFNIDSKKGVAAWKGKTHTEEARFKMRESQKPHNAGRSRRMISNNPMKNPELVAKMLATRKLNREKKNGKT